LGGDCVTTFVETNKRVRGNVYHAAFFPADEEAGLTEESRLYLFSSDEAKAKFFEIVENNVDADAWVDADVAEAGICVVTRQERRKIAAGDRDKVVWYGGLRYFFAGDEERERFLADPFRYISH
jgi:YHS domain-containing protein